MIKSEVPYNGNDMVRLAQTDTLQQLHESINVFVSSDKGEMLR